MAVRQRKESGGKLKFFAENPPKLPTYGHSSEVVFDL